MSEDMLKVLFGDLKLAQALFWLLCAVALLVLIVKAWPKIRKVMATLDELSVLPERMKLLDEIHHEVRPNTGTSLNDAVRRVEAKVNAQGKRLKRQEERIVGLQKLMEDGDSAMEERIGNIEDTLNPKETL